MSPRQDGVDGVLATVTVDTLLSDVVLPYLRDLGDRWQRGEASIAHEHHASGVLRGRLLGLARGWGLGVGPTAVLACLPGEQHDLGLTCFGLALRWRGWRIVYLGPDAPIDTVADVSDQLKPNLVVLYAIMAERVQPLRSTCVPSPVGTVSHSAVRPPEPRACAPDEALLLGGDVVAKPRSSHDS